MKNVFIVLVINHTNNIVWVVLNKNGVLLTPQSLKLKSVNKMGIKDWLGFEGGSSEAEGVDLDEYLEGIGLHEGELLDEDKYSYVKSLGASSPEIMADAERELKKGNIVILDTESIAQTNRLGLKKLVGNLKNLESEINGDMGRISETKILIVPAGFRILKRKFE